MARLAPEDRRRELVGLGLELLLTRPLTEISIDDVAARAGISRSLLFHYYPTKRDYLAAVVRAASRRLLVAAEAGGAGLVAGPEGAGVAGAGVAGAGVAGAGVAGAAGGGAAGAAAVHRAVATGGAAEGAAANGVAASDADGRARIAVGLDALLTWIERRREPYVGLLRAAAADEVLAEASTAAQDELARRILRALGIADADPLADLCVHGWLAMMQEMAVRWVGDPAGISREDLREHLERSLDAALPPPAPRPAAR